LVNLLTNALVATGTGGMVTVAIASRQASVDEAEAGQCTGRAVDVMLLLMVRDTGCGIPQEDLQRVFEPFFTTKAAGKGTGLGLFLSRETVVAHGGSLTIESEVGKGTTVTVALPGWRPERAEVG
jgi:signal transduction histidine kinase